MVLFGLFAPSDVCCCCVCGCLADQIVIEFVVVIAAVAQHRDCAMMNWIVIVLCSCFRFCPEEPHRLVCARARACTVLCAYCVREAIIIIIALIFTPAQPASQPQLQASSPRMLPCRLLRILPCRNQAMVLPASALMQICVSRTKHWRIQYTLQRS